MIKLFRNQMVMRSFLITKSNYHLTYEEGNYHTGSMSIFHRSRPTHHKAFTALLVGTGVVLFWRGLWGLADLMMFPGDPILSNLLSLIIGIGILSFTHYLVRELM